MEPARRDVDRTLIRANLALTVTQRFERLMELQRFAEELRHAGRGGFERLRKNAPEPLTSVRGSESRFRSMSPLQSRDRRGAVFIRVILF